MLEIVNLTHGEILNHHYGTETEKGLEVEVIGLARSGDRVTVNGVETARCGERFSAKILLDKQFNHVNVLAEGYRGTSSRDIQVVWDKASFRRINFCIDDHIFLFREIAQQRPKSLFDHFYLKRLRELHKKYGMLVTLNIFEEDSRSPFTLKDFPDCYKQEWIDNSDWLRLAFHARTEFPDRIYQNAEVGTVIADYDRVAEHIIRFAGKETLFAPPNIHWSMIKPEVIPDLCKRGVRFLGGLFIDAQTRIGESVGAQKICDIGYFEEEENSLFLQQNQLWYDFRCSVTMGTESTVINLEEMPVLAKKLQYLMSLPKVDALHTLTHEQYSFPCYEQYLPDHLDRIEYMAKTMTEAGYRFVFFNEGFLGNPVWGK